MDNEEIVIKDYEKAMKVFENLEKLGFSSEETSQIIEQFSLEQIETMFNTFSNNKLDPKDMKQIFLSGLDNSHTITIDDLVDEDIVNPNELSKDSAAIEDLMQNEELYIPNQNTQIIEEQYKSMKEKEQEVIDRFDREKSTDSLKELVYQSVNPRNSLNTINVNLDSNNKPHLTSNNNNNNFNWVESGKFLSIEDLHDSLLNFYKENKKEKYKILLPDGKMVKYKISKQNIDQIGKKIKESSSILLGEKKEGLTKGENDIRKASLISIDDKEKNILHQAFTNIDLGKKGITNYKEYKPGRYVPEQEVKKELTSIFRRTTPWGVLKTYLTSLEKEQSMVDRAIEGSRGK